MRKSVGIIIPNIKHQPALVVSQPASPSRCFEAHASCWATHLLHSTCHGPTQPPAAPQLESDCGANWGHVGAPLWSSFLVQLAMTQYCQAVIKDGKQAKLGYQKIQWTYVKMMCDLVSTIFKSTSLTQIPSILVISIQRMHWPTQPAANRGLGHCPIGAFVLQLETATSD